MVFKGFKIFFFSVCKQLKGLVFGKERGNEGMNLFNRVKVAVNSIKTKAKFRYAFFAIVPTVLIIFTVIIYPLFYAVNLSFKDVRLGADDRFIGFNNYISLLTNPNFQQAVVVTLVFTVISVILVVCISFGIAFLINQNLKGNNLLKFALLLPYALPGTLNAVMWQWMFDSSYGIINFVLKELGLITTYITFSSSPNYALPAIIIAYVWKFVPYSAFLFLAGLTTIPKEVYEASVIDGSTGLRQFFKITLPLLKPVFQLVLIVQTTFALLMHFGLVYVITGGGPGMATTTVPWFIYKDTFDFMRFGRGSAGAVILAVMMLGFIYLYLVVLRPKRKGAYY